MPNKTTSKLQFSELPQLTIATNLFRCRIPIRYKDEPLIEMVESLKSTFVPSIPIYHNDGTKLAIAKGSALYLTSEGKKAGLVMDHPDKRTVCRLGQRTLFEIVRTHAASLKMTAELFASDGVFFKWSPESFAFTEQLLSGPLASITNCKFNIDIGIQIGPTTYPSATGIDFPVA